MPDDAETASDDAATTSPAAATPAAIEPTTEVIATGEQAVAKLKAFPYPKRAELTDEVDMVMKGGITSGVVYPLAVCQLATTRAFRNVGGSSAGGIAAGMAAVAELARDDGGFNRLAALPDDLGVNLLNMFQPSPETKPLFDVLMAAQDQDHGPVVKYARLAGKVIAGAWQWFAVVAGVSVFLMFLGVMVASGAPHDLGDWVSLFVGMLFVLIPVLALALVAAVVGLGVGSKKRLEANGYGLCRGSNGAAWPEAAPGPGPGGVEPFADWMHAKLNHIAGVDRGFVLTLGHLAGKPDQDEIPDDARIRLEMMTTNVTFCRPERLPFKSNIYFFCPTELRRYYPPPVVKHLIDHADPATKTWHCPDHGDELLHLPRAGRLPVLVVMRMTLSFPALISAVPLFAIDFAAVKPGPVRCWFSDGGISSNFPIHFFDALWPKRPTFGISLAPYPPDRERKGVYFRGKSKAVVPRVRDTSTLFGFGSAIADTLQNWSDEGQATLPGYRDRIVEVHHSEEEGGMNLNMSSEQIMSMCLRGYEAAVALDGFDFEHHRKERYRLAMAQLDKAVRNMAGKYDDKLPGGLPGYRAFINKPSAVDRIDRLLAFVGRPPEPDLRIVPHF
jgi:hypothetical protein